jgi:hypothetical protein
MRKLLAQEYVDDLAEDALETACDQEEAFVQLRALCNQMIANARARKSSLTEKATRVGFTNGRKDLIALFLAACFAVGVAGWS